MADQRRSAGVAWTLRLLVSLVLGGGFALALVRHIEVVPSSFDLAWWTVPAFVGVLVPYFFARAARWHLLVRGLDDGVPLGTSTRVALAGTLWIMILPLRLGEFARPLFLAQTTGISASRAFGTIAIERVADGLTVCLLFFVAVGLGPQPPAATADAVADIQFWGTVATGVLGTALVGLLLTARFPLGFGRLVSIPIGWFSKALATKAQTIASGVGEGLAALPTVGAVGRFAAATVGYWSINALGMWVLAQGCGLDLSPLQAIAVMAVLNITLLVPGGPAQFGNFHFGVVLGLTMYLGADVVRAAGSAYVFVLYAGQLGMGLLVGLWAHRSLGLRLRGLFTPGGPGEDGAEAP